MVDLLRWAGRPVHGLPYSSSNHFVFTAVASGQSGKVGLGATVLELIVPPLRPCEPAQLGSILLIRYITENTTVSRQSDQAAACAAHRLSDRVVSPHVPCICSVFLLSVCFPTSFTIERRGILLAIRVKPALIGVSILTAVLSFLLCLAGMVNWISRGWLPVDHNAVLPELKAVGLISMLLLVGFEFSFLYNGSVVRGPPPSLIPHTLE